MVVSSYFSALRSNIISTGALDGLLTTVLYRAHEYLFAIFIYV